MAMDGKVCVHCREVNPIDARECRNCGRFFIHRPGAARDDDPPMLEALKQPEVLCALALFVSLFLPWLTILFFSLSAIQLLGLFKGAVTSGMRFGAGTTLALARLFIALIPAGCLAIIVIALRGGSAILIGKITGLLPLGVFLLFFLQGSNILSMMGAGFVIAIFAGLGLFVFSRGRP